VTLNPSPSIAAIILAAGRSRRMGTQKLLLPWAGKTFIEHIVDQVASAGLQPILVVIGGDAAADVLAIEKALSGRQIKLVHNPDRDAEMLSSVRCGLKAVPSDCEAALIFLGDQPTVRSELIQQLLQSYRTTGRSIVVPKYGDKHGHPALISARYFAEILDQYDGVGLRGLMAAHPDDIQEISVSDPNVIADINLPADYERHRSGASFSSKESSD
jgi:molybdenum cofactor cytidylyltransferase